MSSQIEVLRDDPVYKIYRTSCECMDERDTVTISIEADCEVNQVVMELYYITRELTSCYYVNNPLVRIFNTLVKRIKVAFRILFTGRIETQGGFIFRNIKHIDEFCDTIQQAKNDIINYQKERLENGLH